MVECVDAASARQWQGKYMSLTTDVHTTMEELLDVVFSM
jgi:hypothetical protein